MSTFKQTFILGLAVVSVLLTVPSARCDTQSSQSRDKAAASRKRVGWVERMRVYPENMLFEVKLTPGSEGNVIHGDRLNVFRRGGERWLRFQLSDREGKSALVERKVTNRITLRNTRGGLEHHYEVRIGFCIDRHYAELNFAVRDRSDFEYEARLGRDALAGIFLVDPAATHLTEPNCSERTLRKAMADSEPEQEPSPGPSPAAAVTAQEKKKTKTPVDLVEPLEAAPARSPDKAEAHKTDD